jgi:hypothetical protein
MGLICDGKLLARLSFIIGQNVAPRTPHGVSSFRNPLMSDVQGLSYQDSGPTELSHLKQDNLILQSLME